MSSLGGPNIVTNGLVLHLDAANGKSFNGESAINMVSSPQFTSFTNVTVGDASVIKTNFGGGRIGIQMTQVATSNIVGFTVPLTTSTLTSGETYTLSSEIESTKTGALVKSQVTVQVNGVTHWLTNSNTWTTTVTECNHLFNPLQIGVSHKVTTTFTMPVGTLANFSFGGFYRVTANFTLKIANVQFEAKSYATPFVIGTRGTTVATGGGWADKSGNKNHSELVNGPGFNSKKGGSITFDGTNDYIGLSGTSFSISQPWSFSIDLKTNTAISSAWKNLIGANADTECMWMLHPAGLAFYQAYYNTTAYIWWSGITATNLLVGTWNNVVITCTPVSSSITHFISYLNGIKIYESDFTWAPTNNTQLFSRVGGNGSRYFNGEVPILKIYNRALSTQEILQNYNATKSRFNS